MNLWSAAGRGDVARLRELLGVSGGGGACSASATSAAAAAAAAHAPRTDVNKGDDYGHTALHEAALAGHAAAAEVLLAAGAQVDNAVCGATPLHRAAALGRGAVVTLLLRAGADVTARDRSTGDLRTPLSKAAAAGHADVVRDLLAAGSAVSAVDARGMTPWQLATAGGHAEVAALLVRAGAVAEGALPPPLDERSARDIGVAVIAASVTLPAPGAPTAIVCACCGGDTIAAQFVASSALPPSAAAIARRSDPLAKLPFCMACCRAHRILPPSLPGR